MKKLTCLIAFLTVLITLSGCVGPVCGNGTCEIGETEQTCPEDCGTVETHLECQKQQCVEATGAGQDQCATDADCNTPGNSYDLCPSLGPGNPESETEVKASINGQEIGFKGDALIWGSESNINVLELGAANKETSRIIIELNAPSVIKFLKQRLGKDGLKGAIDSALVSQATAIISQQQDTVLNLAKSAFPKIEKTSSFRMGFNGITLDLKGSNASQVINTLKATGMVKNVYQNLEVQTTATEVASIVKADTVWNLLDTNGQKITGRGIKIGIIDTGVDYTHPDLGGCFGPGCKVAGGYDFANDDPDPMDDKGHGTHVAGIAAGQGDVNGIAPDAEIYAIKVLAANGKGTTETVLQGMDWAIDPNADGNPSDHLDVINMSLGANINDPDSPTSTKADEASDAGVTVVVSAGNNGPNGDSIGSPGSSRKAITVGALYKDDLGSDVLYHNCTDTAPQHLNQPACFSSRGNAEQIAKPDIAAPGVSICAARWDNAFESSLNNPDRPDITLCSTPGHIAISGTSMSSPVVAGAAALIKQAHPDWTPADIKSSMQFSAAQLPEPHEEVGYGLLDVNAALNQGILVDNTQQDAGNVQGLDTKTLTYTFKNVSDSQKKIKLEFADPNNHGPFSDNGEACIQPGGQKEISFELQNLSQIEYGIHLKEIGLKTFENCTDITPKKETTLLYSMKKMKKINVTINSNKYFNEESLYYMIGILSPQRLEGFKLGIVSYFDGTPITESFEVKNLSDFVVLTSIRHTLPGIELHETSHPILFYIAKGGSLASQNETSISINDSDTTKVQTNLMDFLIEKCQLWYFYNTGINKPCGIQFGMGSSGSTYMPCRKGTDKFDIYLGSANLPSFCTGNLNVLISVSSKDANETINEADQSYSAATLLPLQAGNTFQVNESDFAQTSLDFCQPVSNQTQNWVGVTPNAVGSGSFVFFTYGDENPIPMRDKTLNYFNDSDLAYGIWYKEEIQLEKQVFKEVFNVNGKYFSSPNDVLNGSPPDSSPPNYPSLPFPANLDFCNPPIP